MRLLRSLSNAQLLDMFKYVVCTKTDELTGMNMYAMYMYMIKKGLSTVRLF